MAQLLCLESMDPDRDISIYINSPGGSYTAMTAIYDTMQFVKPEVQTVCLGQAASAAAVLLAAGSPGKRCVAARADSDPPAILRRWRPGTDIEIRERNPADAHRDGGHHRSPHGSLTDDIERDIERDKILTAPMAKEYGIVDQVIESRKVAPK